MTANNNAQVRWLKVNETGDVLFVLQVLDPESPAECESCQQKFDEFYEVHLDPDGTQMIFCADHVIEDAKWVNGPEDDDDEPKTDSVPKIKTWGEDREWADDREETDSCEKGTPGCSIAHSREARSDGDCATW